MLNLRYKYFVKNDALPLHFIRCGFCENIVQASECKSFHTLKTKFQVCRVSDSLINPKSMFKDIYVQTLLFIMWPLLSNTLYALTYNCPFIAHNLKTNCSWYLWSSCWPLCLLSLSHVWSWRLGAPSHINRLLFLNWSLLNWLICVYTTCN